MGIAPYQGQLHGLVTHAVTEGPGLGFTFCRLEVLNHVGRRAPAFSFCTVLANYVAGQARDRESEDLV